MSGLWHGNKPVPEDVLAGTASAVARLLGVHT
jgi:hypothetical protein